MPGTGAIALRDRRRVSSTTLYCRLNGLPTPRYEPWWLPIVTLTNILVIQFRHRRPSALVDELFVLSAGGSAAHKYLSSMGLPDSSVAFVVLAFLLLIFVTPLVR
jgi:hypothetical protein